MEFNSKNIKKSVQLIRENIEKLNNKFKVENSWNDDVHTSFGVYVNLCKKNCKSLEEIDDKCSEICRKLNGLKIDAEIKKTQDEVTKANSLSKSADELARRVI